MRQTFVADNTMPGQSAAEIAKQGGARTGGLVAGGTNETRERALRRALGQLPGAVLHDLGYDSGR